MDVTNYEPLFAIVVFMLCDFMSVKMCGVVGLGVLIVYTIMTNGAIYGNGL